MKQTIGRALLLVIGAAIGSGLTVVGSAQQPPPRSSGMRLNSVGLSVKNFDQMFAFYTGTVGLREAFTLRDKDGRPTMSFLQINRDTFLQLVPSNANRPPGLSSVLLGVDDVPRTTQRLRDAGVEIADPRISPNTSTLLTSFRDPEGFRVELLQVTTPGSLIGKAMESAEVGR